MPFSSFKAVLTDIEGTTTSIDFVKNVLFPFAAKNVVTFLGAIAESGDHRQLVEELVKSSNKCAAQDAEVTPIPEECSKEELVARVSANVRLWIRQDRKYTALKSLQGTMWEEGYRDGTLKAQHLISLYLPPQPMIFPSVYADVPATFKRLTEAGIPIYIFSSGSCKAQQLLFAHTAYGDLTTYISGYFDTNVGPKFESGSFDEIVRQIGIEARDLIFLTDVEREATAAREAGLQVGLFLREGNAPLSDGALQKYEAFHSFEELK